MAIHRRIKPYENFYKSKHVLTEVVIDKEGIYWIKTSAVRMYDLLLKYYQTTEPEHPLLQKKENPDRVYKTVDFSINNIDKWTNIDATKELSKEELSELYVEKDIPQTELLDYLIDHYGVGERLVSYYVISRRTSSYGDRISVEMLPIFEALGFGYETVEVRTNLLSNHSRSFPRATIYGLRSQKTERSFSSLLHSFLKNKTYAVNHPTYMSGESIGFLEKPIHPSVLRVLENDIQPNSLDHLFFQFEEEWKELVARYESVEIPKEITTHLSKKLKNSDKQQLYFHMKNPILTATNSNVGTTFRYDSRLSQCYYRYEDILFSSFINQKVPFYSAEGSGYSFYLNPTTKIRKYYSKPTLIETEKKVFPKTKHEQLALL